jgi:hypothetical protein
MSAFHRRRNTLKEALGITGVTTPLSGHVRTGSSS